jgi:hypothetical protein
MKLRLTFKDPDGVYDSLKEEAIRLLDEEQSAQTVQDKINDLYDVVEDYITFGEYVTIEIDTDAGTATVVQ